MWWWWKRGGERKANARGAKGRIDSAQIDRSKKQRRNMSSCVKTESLQLGVLKMKPRIQSGRERTVATHTYTRTHTQWNAAAAATLPPYLTL